MSLDAVTRAAVTTCVQSIEELDVLLHLARWRDRYCSPDSVAAATGVTPAAAVAALEALAARNLLDVRIADAVLYRLDPATMDTRESLEQVLAAARRQRAAVVRIILGSTSAGGRS